MAKTVTVKATLTESSKGGDITIRLFLGPRQRERFLLQRGSIPKGIINKIIVVSK